jgi:hypothetical protein
MASAARARGYEYLAIGDHTPAEGEGGFNLQDVPNLNWTFGCGAMLGLWLRLAPNPRAGFGWGTFCMIVRGQPGLGIPSSYDDPQSVIGAASR